MKKVLLIIALCCITSILLISCKKDNAALQYSEAGQPGNTVQAVDDMSTDANRKNNCMTPSVKSIATVVTRSQDGLAGDAFVQVSYKNKGNAGYIKVVIKWHTGKKAESFLPAEHTVGDEQKLTEVHFLDWATEFPGTLTKVVEISSKERCPNKDSGFGPLEIAFSN